MKYSRASLEALLWFDTNFRKMAYIYYSPYIQEMLIFDQVIKLTHVPRENKMFANEDKKWN